MSPLWFASLIALAPRAARADLHISWRAPQGCPSEGNVREATLRTSGAGSEDRGDRIEAEITVDRLDDRWTATIHTKRAGVSAEERKLEATSCQGLADATAVIVAMTLVSPATFLSFRANPARDTVSAEPASPVSTPVPSVTRSPAPSSRMAAAGVAIVGGVGALPSTAAGGRVHLGWTPGRGRIELAGTYFGAQSKTTGTSGAGASLGLMTVGARGCWAVARTAVEVSPCAGADLQIVRASGFGAETNYDRGAAWITAGAGGLVRVPISPGFSLRADAEAAAPLSRPRFVVDGDGAIHKPAVLGARAAIGAEFLFF